MPKPKKPKTFTCQYERERETKNYVRFAQVVEDGEEAIAPQLYLRKKTVGNAQTLTVTITRSG